ncbi:MAG: enoyl-CoA hydratase [Rhodocyclaceae bacterium]
MSATVLLDVQDGVATLTLNRPKQLNALSVEMMAALRQGVEQAVGHPEARVIVFKGAGDHFMAGGDLNDFHARLDLDPAARTQAFRAMIDDYINPMLLALREAPQPVVCSVRGACAGFGLSLMLACDLALVADNAYFTTAYAWIGLSPDGGGTWFLPRIVGSRKAAELFLLAERIDAAQALQLGLVNRVVAVDQLDIETAALAKRLVKGPGRAYREVRRLLAASQDNTFAAQLQAESESFGRCAATEDFAEGVRAFVGKRKASFNGR